MFNLNKSSTRYRIREKDNPEKWHYFDLTQLLKGDKKIEMDLMDEKTLTKFTGLKDENGVNIYEGDIVMLDLEAINTYVYEHEEGLLSSVGIITYIDHGCELWVDLMGVDDLTSIQEDRNSISPEEKRFLEMRERMDYNYLPDCNSEFRSKHDFLLLKHKHLRAWEGDIANTELSVIGNIY